MAVVPWSSVVGLIRRVLAGERGIDLAGRWAQVQGHPLSDGLAFWFGAFMACGGAVLCGLATRAGAAGDGTRRTVGRPVRLHVRFMGAGVE